MGLFLNALGSQIVRSRGQAQKDGEPSATERTP